MSSTLTKTSHKTAALKSIKPFFILYLLLVFFASIPSAAAGDLIGFEQITKAIDGRSVKLLYKLKGKRFELQYDQLGNFELTLEPKELFVIEKTGSNSFVATIVNPKGLWAKYKDRTFKLKWFIIELVD